MSRLFVVTTAVALIATGLIVAAAIVVDDGHLVYLTDDPAIHLSMANNLVHHGTWGVVPGHFESASSSPGWTLLLGGTTAILRPLANVLPLLLNVAAGIWLIWIFATNQRLVDRRDRSWTMVAVAIVLGVVVLYLPALAILGMEHTLQCALVLYAFVLLERLRGQPLTVRALLPLLGIVLLGTLVRYETAFVAAGIGVAFLVGTTGRLGAAEAALRWRPGAALRAAAMVGAAAAVPIAALGLVNLSAGRDFLPNSIVAKADAAQDPGGLFRSPTGIPSDLARDPLVLAGFLVAVVALVWAWYGGPRGNAIPATAFVVTALLHAQLADFGWYERYQTYLVVVGVYLAFQILADTVPAQLANAAKLSLAVVIAVLAVTRIDLTISAPRASSNTYRQRYQVGRFFERAYDGDAVATTELGYPSLYHRGPIVDLLGLGSHDVLDLIEGPGLDPDRLAAVLDEHDARVLAIISYYPLRPRGWELGGSWFLDERLVPGPQGGVMEFWAPPSHRDELRRKLEAFESRLPDRVVAAYPPRDGGV